MLSLIPMLLNKTNWKVLMNKMFHNLIQNQGEI